MSQIAQEKINKIKLKDRSHLKLKDWDKNKYYKTKFTKELYDNCPDDVERINHLEVSHD